jgi:hypothetical protein
MINLEKEVKKMCKEIDFFFDGKMKETFNGKLIKFKKPSRDKYPQMHWTYACIEELIKNQGVKR